ncbi:hypothetical protein J6590_090798 [Homalodisca vitripennis]|nr:hypothetical protein J6590_090798 [Homalodisca vitripennis]
MCTAILECLFHNHDLHCANKSMKWCGRVQVNKARATEMRRQLQRASHKVPCINILASVLVDNRRYNRAVFATTQTHQPDGGFPQSSYWSQCPNDSWIAEASIYYRIHCSAEGEWFSAEVQLMGEAPREGLPAIPWGASGCSRAHTRRPGPDVAPLRGISGVKEGPVGCPHRAGEGRWRAYDRVLKKQFGGGDKRYRATKNLSKRHESYQASVIPADCSNLCREPPGQHHTEVSCRRSKPGSVILDSEDRHVIDILIYERRGSVQEPTLCIPSVTGHTSERVRPKEYGEQAVIKVINKGSDNPCQLEGDIVLRRKPY